jgi:hypothetical protein
MNIIEALDDQQRRVSSFARPKMVHRDASRELATAGRPVRPKGYSDREWEAALADATRLGYPA